MLTHRAGGLIAIRGTELVALAATFLAEMESAFAWGGGTTGSAAPEQLSALQGV